MTQLYIDKIGQGPPLIMLHGWGWDSTIWQPLVPLLKKYYCLYLIDLPGFGRSPLVTNTYSFAAIAPFLLEKVPRQATWVGWSLGGLFVYWLAIHYPERVLNFITITSSPCFIHDNDWPGISVATLENFSKLLQLDANKTLLDFLKLQLRGNPKQEDLFQHLKSHLQLTQPPSMHALLGGLALLRETDLRKNLTAISCPSLHLFGQLDTIVAPQTANLILNRLPQAKVHIFQRTGHLPFLAQPEHFVDLLTAFQFGH